ncbi:MAG: Acyl-CoA dehydrogenase [Frankiales bacterium]|nr:Acyl-CoA dehydrogenase [Frankiales bacterium]
MTELDELRHAVRALVERRADRTALRRTLDSDAPFDPALWEVMSAQLGLPGLAVSDRYGGAGQTLAAVAVVLEEFGRANVPTPYLSTVLAAQALALTGDDGLGERVLPRLAAGARAAFVLSEPDSLDVRQVGGAWRLTGTVGHVVDAPSAELLVLPAAGRVFVLEMAAPGVVVRPLSTIDLTRPQATVDLTDAAADAADVPDLASWSADVRAWAVAALAAEQVGGAQWCVDTAVAHATARHQFGRPVGSFQAVKHLCADMLVELELARAVTAAAVAAVDASSPDRHAAGEAAHVVVSEAAASVGRSCVQVLGGIGFTWDHDAHLFWRRALASRGRFGGMAAARDRLYAASRSTAGAATPDQAAPTSELATRATAFFRAHGTPRDLLTRRAMDLETYVQNARAHQRALQDSGLAGITWPQEHGGQGLGPQDESVVQRVSRAYETYTDVFTIGLGMCGPVLLALGSAEQKERHLRRMLRGEDLWCQLFSEPEAGSDLASLRTRAVRDGEGWRITGQKVWTSFADRCDYGLLLARTDPTQAKHRGITMFVLDLRAPGVEVRPLRQITGDAEFCEVFLDDVVVPDTAVVGEVNGGWRAAQVMLMNERAALGQDAAPILEVVTLRTVQDLIDAGGLDSDPVVRQRMGQLYAGDRALAAFGRRIAASLRAGEDPGPFASIGKLAAAALSEELAAVGLDLSAEDGLAWDTDDPAGDVFAYGRLLAPSSSIAGGTTQIQRTIVGERVLGLPREPAVT